MKGRGKGNEWLLIKKRDEFAAPGWDVEEHAYSVLSGRTQEEIAQQSAGAQDQAQDGRRVRSRLGEQPPAEASAAPKSAADRRQASRAPRKKNEHRPRRA